MRKQGFSLRKIADEVGMTRAGVLKVLRNRFYLGYVKFDGKEFKGQHEPIISEELFYAVNKKNN